MSEPFSFSAVSLAGTIALFGCLGCVTDHDLFAASEGAGGATGGRAGAPGSGGVRHGTGGKPAIDGSAGSGDHAGPTEPAGPRAVSFMNGVTDAPWVSFCFAKVAGGVEAPPKGKPFPAGTLEYGKSVTVASIAGVDFDADAIRPYVVAASPDAISGLDCASILVIARVLDAPPAEPIGVDASIDAPLTDARVSEASVPDADATSDAAHDRSAPVVDAGRPHVPMIRVAALPVIPSGTFGADRHYLFGLAGCMGGPGIQDPSEQSVCGESFTGAHPTLAPVLVTLSRVVTSGRVALQFVNASSVVRAADLRLASKGSNPLSLAKNVVKGAIRPVPPNASQTAGQLGLADEDRIQIFADGSAQPIYDQPWSVTLAAGVMPPLHDGLAYTLLLIGPYPGFAKREWWNDPLVTIIQND